MRRLSRKQRFDFEKGLRESKLRGKSVGFIDAALDALTVRSARIGRIAASDEVDPQRDEFFGQNAWYVDGERIFWLEPNWDVRLAAAREVLSRVEPILNRIDASVTGGVTVVRIDPNESRTVEPPDSLPN